MTLVKYNAKNVYSCGDLRLIPGINDVKGTLLKRALSNPLFKHRIEIGVVEILDEPKESIEESKVENTPKKRGRKKGSSNRNLADLVPHIYDVKLLKNYIEKEKDPKVVEEAKKQLKRIEDVKVEKKEDKEDEVVVGVTIQ